MIGIFLSVIEAQNDKEKFIEIYDTYKDLLYWVAFGKTNNTQDAEECVQETFFYVAKHFEKIGDVHSKRTKCYLVTIVTGFAVDVYNKSKKFNSALIEDNRIYAGEDFEAYDKLELLSAFDEALDEESRVFLYLKYIYGYKSAEIAEMYRVKDAYVRKKIQRAKEKLRKYLDEGGDLL